MSAIDAAVTLAEASGWSLTNLQLQKLLYLGQMSYMGASGGQPIFAEDFQAWKLGPVLPSVYKIGRDYGSGPVRSLFHKGQLPPGAARDTLLEVYKDLKDKSAWDLVAITHWQGGAWYKNFMPGSSFTPIPKSDILDEYRARVAASTATAAA